MSELSLNNKADTGQTQCISKYKKGIELLINVNHVHAIFSVITEFNIPGFAHSQNAYILFKQIVD